jgi:hypothetical protein
MDAKTKTSPTLDQSSQMDFEVDHQSNMKQCYPILLWGGF